MGRQPPSLDKFAIGCLVLLSSFAAPGAWAQTEDELLGTAEIVISDSEDTLAVNGGAAALGDVFREIELESAQNQFNNAATGFELNGSGMTVVVIDSGLNTAHVDFAGRIKARLNLTSDNQGDENDVTDGLGHGTHVTGIIAASLKSGRHQGIAPEAQIIPIKIIKNNGSMEEGWPAMVQALEWVLANRETHNISAVNISIGHEINIVHDHFMSDSRFEVHVTIKDLIGQLEAPPARIPVVVASGNKYYTYNPADDLSKWHEADNQSVRRGMDFPAMISKTISVGACYVPTIVDEKLENGHEHTAFKNATSHKIVRFQIAPFTQRFWDAGDNKVFNTDIFAPGGLAISSTGWDSPIAEKYYCDGGTSQAAPFVTGTVLLMQQYYQFLHQTTRLPDVALIEKCLKAGPIILDGDDEYDNVRHTCGQFRRLSVLHALEAINNSAVSSPFGNP